MIHPTYKHLERRIRVAGLPLGQWALLVAAGFAAYALAQLLPFSSTYNLSVAITIAGAPAAATIMGDTGETHLFRHAAALLAWQHAAHLYVPGAPPATPSAGYSLAPSRNPAATGRAAAFDPRRLWSDEPAGASSG